MTAASGSSHCKDLMTSPDEHAEDILYRLAYGCAARLWELRRGSSDPRVWRDGLDTAAAEILAAVVRRVGCDPEDPIVAEAVEDAVAGRRPRW